MRSLAGLIERRLPSASSPLMQGGLLPRLLGAVFLVDTLTVFVVISYGSAYLLNTLRAPASYPGLALGAYGLMKLVSSPPNGWLVDRTSVRTAALVATALQLAGLFAMLLWRSANGYVVGVALLSTGTALVWVLLLRALALASAPEGRAGATASLGVTSAAASGTGYLLAAASEVWLPSWAPFVCGLGVAAGAGVLLASVHGVPRQSSRSETSPAVFDRVMLLLAAVVLLHFAVFSAMLVTIGPLALRVLGLSLFQVGILLVPAGVAAVVTMLTFTRTRRPGARLAPAALLYTLGAVGLLLATRVSNPLLFAIEMIPVGACVSGSYPLINATVLDVSASRLRTGSVIGWLLMVEGVGGVVGPLVIAALLAATSVRLGVFSLGVACLALACLAYGISRSRMLSNRAP